MAFQISVYYPTEQERKEMNDLILKERKALKKLGIKTPADMGLTHGGLLLALGRLWRSHPEIKTLVRGAYGLLGAGKGAEKAVLPKGKDRPRKGRLNAKSAET